MRRRFAKVVVWTFAIALVLAAVFLTVLAPILLIFWGVMAAGSLFSWAVTMLDENDV